MPKARFVRLRCQSLDSFDLGAKGIDSCDLIGARGIDSFDLPVSQRARFVRFNRRQRAKFVRLRRQSATFVRLRRKRATVFSVNPDAIFSKVILVKNDDFTCGFKGS